VRIAFRHRDDDATEFLGGRPSYTCERRTFRFDNVPLSPEKLEKTCREIERMATAVAVNEGPRRVRQWFADRKKARA
jgi:hypothetical protein